MKLLFKKEEKEGLFTYVHVDNAGYANFLELKDRATNHDNIAVDANVYSGIFYNFSALTDFCLGKLDKYLIVNSSPFLQESKSLNIIGSSCWSYRFLSNDFEGIGIDLGFSQKNDSIQHVSNDLCISSLDSVLLLNTLPEDAFGDSVSGCSFFGLKQNRSQELISFFKRVEKPDISTFLSEGEMFIHFVVAKEVGFYNSVLIKSKADIEESINAFQFIINPEN